MDIFAYDTVAAGEQPIVVTLEHPATGEPLADDAGNAVTISILSYESEKARRKLRDYQNRRLKSGGKPITAEQLEVNDIELLAALTTGWEHVERNGESYAFSLANARVLYAALPWVRRQVSQAAGDIARFLGQASSTT